MDRSRWTAYVIARASWLAVELSYEEFSQHLANYAADLGERELETLAPDLYLACACLLGYPAALGVLEFSILPQASQAIAQVSAEPSFVQRCVEVLWQRLLEEPERQLTRYQGQGALAVWVSVVATGIALEHAGGREDGPLALASLYLGHEVGGDLTTLRNALGPALLPAVQTALQQLSARDRNILRMHLSGQCSIGQIGRAYGVHRATAARWLAEIRNSVKYQLTTSTITDGADTSSEEVAFHGTARADRSPSSSNPAGAR